MSSWIQRHGPAVSVVPRCLQLYLKHEGSQVRFYFHPESTLRGTTTKETVASLPTLNLVCFSSAQEHHGASRAYIPRATDRELASLLLASKQLQLLELQNLRVALSGGKICPVRGFSLLSPDIKRPIGQHEDTAAVREFFDFSQLEILYVRGPFGQYFNLLLNPKASHRIKVFKCVYEGPIYSEERLGHESLADVVGRFHNLEVLTLLDHNSMPVAVSVPFPKLRNLKLGGFDGDQIRERLPAALEDIFDQCPILSDFTL